MTQAVSPELRDWLVSQLAAGHSVPALRASMRAAQRSPFDPQPADLELFFSPGAGEL